MYMFDDKFKKTTQPMQPQRTQQKPLIGAPGLSGPTVQLAAPTPNIGDLVDYLDATVRARARVTVPLQAINFLIKMDPPNRASWWKRLWSDPLKHFPTVRVTIELVQVGPGLTPLSHYENHVLLKQALEEYVIRLHSKTPPCKIDFVPALGSAFRITAKTAIEQDLGIPGQLDTLLRAAKIPLPMTGQDQQRLFWIVYATFPEQIRNFVLPEGRVLLDQFAFDKSVLTDVHLDKIKALARYLVAVTKFVGAPPKIILAGHTDARGTEKYNEGLGDRRAAAVNDALRKAIDALVPGLSKQMSITAKSFGETKPLLRAGSEAEHARNRRVEVLMQKPRPRCPRVPIRTVVDRTLKLLPRLSSPEQAQRLACVLKMLLKKGTDDRWAYPEQVLSVYNSNAPFGSYGFSQLRDALSIETMFGPSVPDAAVLRALEQYDERIIQGISEVNRLIQVLSGAVSQGIPLVAKMKAMDALRAWMHDRVQNPASIYNCYKNV